MSNKVTPIVVTTRDGVLPAAVQAFIDESKQPLVHYVEERQFYHPDKEKNRCVNIAKGRTAATKRVFNISGADYFFFLDADIVPQPNAIEMLRSRMVPAISAWIPARFGGYIGGEYITPFDFRLFRETRPGLTATGLISLGCTLLRRDLLIGHTFDPGIDAHVRVDGALCHLADSGAFSRHLILMGITPLLDGDVKCEHLSLNQPVAY